MEEFSWAFENKLERGKKWYAVAATIVITVVIVSFLLSAYLLGIVVILFTGVYLLYEVNSHPVTHVTVSREGISIEGDMFPYRQIESFAILRVNNEPLLLRVRTMSRALGTIDIFLDTSMDLEALRAFLLTMSKEDTEASLSVIDHLLLGLRL
jgi:hypothetical protein